jgi:toxin ParE1/3/4
VKVFWSQRALRELRHQRRYIAQTQPDAAARIGAQIIEATDRLETYPHYGRAAEWDESGRLRELPVAGTPFVVLYALDDAADELIIVRVVHGAQLRGPE